MHQQTMKKAATAAAAAANFGFCLTRLLV